PIKHRARLVALAPRQRRERTDGAGSNPIEQLAYVERGRIPAEIERTAFDRDRIALQRGLGDAERSAGAHIPLPEMHVAGEHRAVEEALAKRYLLVRADRLEAEEFPARIRHHDLQAVFGLALLEAVFRHLDRTSQQTIAHGLQLNLS